MFEYVSIVGTVSTVIVLLMISAMLYLVWIGFENDAHKPSPDDGDRPELDDGEESPEPQSELAEGNSV